MQVNNYSVVDRHNRPNISQRVALRTFFINDGAYVDPYEISSVQLFKKSDTLTPKAVINTAGEGLVSATPLMTFAASATPPALGYTVHCTQPLLDDDTTCVGSFDVSHYKPGTTASGIYRLGVGDYVVVLDQTLNLSGWDFNTSTATAASGLSAVNDYADLWTVKLVEASKYQVITNEFSLHEDTFFAFTEPLLLTTTNKLYNKHVRYGEIIDLKVGTEVTLQNKDVDKSLQNIFKDSVVTAATVTIKKVNQDPTFDGPFKVVNGAIMEITSDNTLIYNWDTVATIGGGSTTFGSPTGMYSVQVEYAVLNQIIKSPLYYLTVS